MRADLDLVSVARKFYRTHADAYDQLVIWTDAPLTPETAFAFEVTVANEIDGIGIERFDGSSEFGSTSRRLRSLWKEAASSSGLGRPFATPPATSSAS